MNDKIKKSLIIEENHYLFSDIFTKTKNKNTKKLKQFTIGKNGISEINKINYDISNHIVFEPNNLIIGIGINEVATSIDKKGCCSPIYSVFSINNKLIDTLFCKYYIPIVLLKNKNLICKKSTRRDFEIINECLYDLKLTLPNIETQKKVGNMFKILDDLIALHEEKLVALETYNKGLRQKLFNQNVRFKRSDGSNYPEWEEKRLENISKRVTRKNTNNISNIPLTISSIKGLIDQRTFFNKIIASKDMSGYYLLKKGEFAYNKSYSNGYDFGSIKRLDMYENGALSTLYICFSLNDNENSDFYQKYFDSLNWYSEMKKICTEGARNHGLLNVQASSFFKIKFKIPKDTQEQQKIAEVLSYADELTEQFKGKISFLKDTKTSLLNKIFK